MCQGQMHEFLKALPKCEHHMHLEGSLEPDLLFELAARNNITLPQDDASFASPAALVARYRRFTSLDDFLHYYFIGMTVLRTAADFEALASAYFARVAAAHDHAHDGGVVHAEVFFDPQAHTSRGVDYATVVAGFSAALTRARSELGISCALIVCVLRHLPPEDGLEMYRRAIPDLQAGDFVTGLGLSSTELGNPPAKYRDIFADAEARGFNRTAHAGEEADVTYMAAALHELHVTRVDHGIKLVEDEAVMAEFVAKGIMVTMCPLSNVELRCVKRVADLPVRRYLDAGVKFSINSDDPAYFGGYILDNYCAVQEAFGLSTAEWERIVRNSIEGSWCSSERKAEITRLLEDVMVKYRD
ncbi:adenosine deaminase [Cladophialophora carrionii CBS 160.54]|uniref:Adenine deaminase n=1 Tax=Cladophialophora carrionii CBS 160.54 TaxID=1279043 RepID=V9D155_9EURO|nr:adenosine deaminase [Cladophialophora carrionii CBS 160.54]ETI19717.1 adenosine deaminase [Cladophialophora carrionii CBS 160.54]